MLSAFLLLGLVPAAFLLGGDDEDQDAEDPEVRPDEGASAEGQGDLLDDPEADQAQEHGALRPTDPDIPSEPDFEDDDDVLGPVDPDIPSDPDLTDDTDTVLKPVDPSLPSDRLVCVVPEHDGDPVQLAEGEVEKPSFLERFAAWVRSAPDEAVADDAAVLPAAEDPEAALAGPDPDADEETPEPQRIPWAGGDVVEVSDFQPGTDKLEFEVEALNGAAPPAIGVSQALDADGMIVTMDGVPVAFLKGATGIGPGDIVLREI